MGSLEGLSKDILIPAYYYQDWDGLNSNSKRHPVVPRDSGWLVSTDRIFTEVDQTIKGMASGISLSITNRRSESPYLINLGIDREITIPAAKLLGYSLLFRRHKDYEEKLVQDRSNIEEEYEKEKRVIRKKLGMKYRATKKIKQIYDRSYKTRIDNLTELSQKEKQITDLVLRSGATEIFSPTEEGGHLLEQIPNVVRELQDATGTPEGKEQISKDINNLINSLGDYLRTTKDVGLFVNYDYKNKPGPVGLAEDARVLSAAMTSYISPEYLDTGVGATKAIKNLSGGYLTFIRNRAVYLSDSGLDRNYPQLSTLYDMVTSAFYTARPEVVANIDEEIIDPLFKDVVETSSFRQECHDCAHDYFKLREKLYSYIVSSDQSKKLIISKGIHVDKEAEDLFNSVARSDSYRMCAGMGMISTSVTEGFTDNQFQSRAIDIAGSHIIKHFGLYSFNSEDDTLWFYSRIDNQLTNQLDIILENDPIEIDLIRYGHYHLPVEMDEMSDEMFKKFINGSLLGEEIDKIYRNRNITVTLKKMALDNPLTTPGGTMLFLRHYFGSVFEEKKEKYKRYTAENEKLWKHILDRSMWFVSPRGDRFSKERDIELEEYGIESITFKIDKKYPREHKVSIKLSGIKNPVKLWLDTKRNILLSDRRALISDSKYYQIFSNLLLRRLYVITSGLLSTDQDRDIDHLDLGNERPVLGWTRAHYRIFIPGGYDLSSYGAQEHAREIKNIYGIDILDEIRRRRKFGMLEHNQFMTFVRESEPELDGLRYKANELSFDPLMVSSSL